MRVKVIDQDKKEVEAEIIIGNKLELPSIHEGWRFNFNKHSKAKDAHVFALVRIVNPTVIEGCLIYKMLNNQEPYMAFIEIAPHNKGSSKKYDLIAGCLIAYACRLSFVLGKGIYKGWLAFDVKEENKSDEKKLMGLYSSKYKALRLAGSTTMIISPEHGESLINQYLKP